MHCPLATSILHSLTNIWRLVDLLCFVWTTNWALFSSVFCWFGLAGWHIRKHSSACLASSLYCIKLHFIFITSLSWHLFPLDVLLFRFCIAFRCLLVNWSWISCSWLLSMGWNIELWICISLVLWIIGNLRIISSLRYLNIIHLLKVEWLGLRLKRTTWFFWFFAYLLAEARRICRTHSAFATRTPDMFDAYDLHHPGWLLRIFRWLVLGRYFFKLIFFVITAVCTHFKL